MSRIWNNLFTKLLEKPYLVPVDQHCLGYIFCILEIICDYSGVIDYSLSDVFIKFMLRYLKADELEFNTKIVICFIDLLWTCLKVSIKTLTDFVKNGGVYLMLDIIQKCSLPVKLVTLGALVDLCDEGSCIPHLITWRGINGQKIKPMLLQIFRNENKSIGVKVGKHGEIADINYPIMGTDQSFDFYCNCPPWNYDNVSVTISDLFASCRPKVYAILQLLGQEHKETVEIANESYQLFNDELDTADKVTMLLAENFFALKLCEIWEEVKIDLDKSNVIPTIVDQEIINYLMERKTKWGQCLQKAQREIIIQDLKNEQQKEEQFYLELMDARLSSALDALKELKYIAKCSEQMFRVTKKIVQEKRITESLSALRKRKSLVRTYIPNFSVSIMLNQSVSIESDAKKRKEPFTIEPVSPNISEFSIKENLNEDLLNPVGIAEEINCKTTE